jgi:hypothetical protein
MAGYEFPVLLFVSFGKGGHGSPSCYLLFVQEHALLVVAPFFSSPACLLLVLNVQIDPIERSKRTWEAIQLFFFVAFSMLFPTLNSDIACNGILRLHTHL